jgi:hypothetical protein
LQATSDLSLIDRLRTHTRKRAHDRGVVQTDDGWHAVLRNVHARTLCAKQEALRHARIEGLEAV